MLSQLTLKRSKRWGDLVSDRDAQFYRACFKYCRIQSKLYSLISLIPKEPHLWLVEQALVKGAPLHFVLRKKIIANQVQAALQEGVKQIVVLGGGFDPLALHVAQDHPRVHTFEIDMLPMHTHKTNIIKLYGDCPSNYHPVSADLSTNSLVDVLGHHRSYYGDKPTLFIAEGLSMYLPEAGVLDWFRNMRELCNQDATCIFTALENHHKHSGGWAGQVRKSSLALNNESFNWSMPYEGMPKFLASHGFKQSYAIKYADLQKRYRTLAEQSVIGRQNGEYIVYATS